MSDGLRDALRKLVFMARTSGGTAGRDDGLVKACEEAETALAAPPQEPPHPAQAPREAAMVEVALNAMRYVWLRDVGDATWRPFGLREGYSAARADSAIDAAIAAQGTTDGGA